MLSFLDILLVVFHSALILFNLFGWIWHKTRRAHLYCISLTILSWFGLGLFYGWGYCPFTDWHWQVKYHLGERSLPASYIKYYLDKITGLDSNPVFVDGMVAVFGLTAFFLAIWLYRRDRKTKQVNH